MQRAFPPEKEISRFHVRQQQKAIWVANQKKTPTKPKPKKTTTTATKNQKEKTKPSQNNNNNKQTNPPKQTKKPQTNAPKPKQQCFIGGKWEMKQAEQMQNGE